MIGSDDLANRFRHHPPKDEETTAKYEQIRDRCLVLAEHIDRTCPDGREKSSAITNLEQVMFWANASIARSDGS